MVVLKNSTTTHFNIFFIFFRIIVMITHVDRGAQRMRPRPVGFSSLVQSTVVGLVNHGLACIEVNLHTAVGLLTSLGAVVAYRVA